jgi:hypothetical protein
MVVSWRISVRPARSGEPRDTGGPSSFAIIPATAAARLVQRDYGDSDLSPRHHDERARDAAAAVVRCRHPAVAEPRHKELATNRILGLDLTGLFGQNRLPFTLLILLFVTGLLILYAVWVSLSPIKAIKARQKGAKLAGAIY